MEHYDRRFVCAPGWMENFQCIAGSCPETCCQQWNIDVDPEHAKSYTNLEDPELQPVIDRLLRRFKIRRPGKREAELQFRLQLLSQPNRRCPILNEKGECRLQKKYGAYILCDTCYFHPRNFWQIDERIFLSACLSCPECARLALLHREPTSFTRFENEIDPNAEWLETSEMGDPSARLLLQNRDALITEICGILQNRQEAFEDRLSRVFVFFKRLAENGQADMTAIRTAAEASLSAGISAILPKEPSDLMRCWVEVFDPVSDIVEKPVQDMAEFTRSFAGGGEGFVRLLAQRYTEGARIADPFLVQNEHLLENFMVHCVFSDSFKQFSRYRNEPMLSVREILRHESALLRIWYLLLRIQLAKTALEQHAMNQELFLQTVIHADRSFWHYPDWFARIADRFINRSAQ